jgi:methylglyoxal synthase
MEDLSLTISARKHIALVAHDGMKQDLVEWAVFNKGTLGQHFLYGTSSTGHLIMEKTALPVTCFHSGPLGGDQQIGAKIVEGVIDFLIFFWDPLQPQPHDPDVKALLRISVLHNIPTASNRATADFMISSPLMTNEYQRVSPDFSQRIQRVT